MLNKFEISKACISGAHAIPKKIDSYTYSAFVKFGAHADYFLPAYSFAHYYGNSKLHVAKAIASDFEKLVTKALSYLEDEYKIDGQFVEDQKKLGEYFRAFLEKLRDFETYSSVSLCDMESECDVGRASYDFNILAEGDWDTFNVKILNALQRDDHLAAFFDIDQPEDEDERLDDFISYGGELYKQFAKLKKMDPEERSCGAVSSFLKRISEVVFDGGRY